MLTLTSPFDTPLHRLPAGAKLAGLALATLALAFVRTPLPLGAAALATVILYAAQGRLFALHGVAMLRPLWPVLLVLALWHGLSGDAAAGGIIALKMVTAVALANLVTMTTRLDDLIAVLTRLARPMGRIGIDPHVLALSIALVIRAIPVLLDRARRVTESWRARSPRRASWRIVLPITLGTLDDADQVADALRARGGLLRP